MGSSNKTKCWNFGIEFSKKQGYCPDCGTISIRRFNQAESFEQIVRSNPKNGLQCSCCGSLYPSNQDKCLICNALASDGFAVSVAHMSKKDIESIKTPIKVEGARLTRKRVQELSKTVRRAKSGLTICVACGNRISTKAESCPHCGEPTGVHVCPKCGGINAKPISGASKATSIVLWGPFAVNKVLSKFQCKDCGHKF